MRNLSELRAQLRNTSASKLFGTIYSPDKKEYQRTRYLHALEQFETCFGDGVAAFFSAPGRSEICGNHTDHQHGKVLAAAVEPDIVAVVKENGTSMVQIKSEGFDDCRVSLQDLAVCEDERGSEAALVKGVLAAMKERGYKIGGFAAYITSDVPVGAGLSSSAAYETLIGTIVSHLFNEGKIGAEEIAVMGRYAENVYFGKPCGLMDQMACCVGDMVYIDFEKETAPKVQKINFALPGYELCITDTKGSHADLTQEYAMVWTEMKAVAACFGREFLREVPEALFYENLPMVREAAGDRALLRALHFYEENKRVERAVDAIRRQDAKDFLAIIKESGLSSFRYLQNAYSNADTAHQNISVALAVGENCLGETGACRVHGGGFAGTVLAFVREDKVKDYTARMEQLFGAGACRVLAVRSVGGVPVM